MYGMCTQSYPKHSELCWTWDEFSPVQTRTIGLVKAYQRQQMQHGVMSCECTCVFTQCTEDTGAKVRQGLVRRRRHTAATAASLPTWGPSPTSSHPHERGQAIDNWELYEFP